MSFGNVVMPAEDLEVAHVVELFVCPVGFSSDDVVDADHAGLGHVCSAVGYGTVRAVSAYDLAAGVSPAGCPIAAVGHTARMRAMMARIRCQVMVLLCAQVDG